MQDGKQRSFGSSFGPFQSKPLFDRAVRWSAIATLATVISFSTAAPAEAGIIVRVPDVEIREGESGFVDIFFEVDGSSDGLAGYQIELNLIAPAGIRFTGFGQPTDAILGENPGQTSARPALPGMILAVNAFTFGADAPITDGAGLIRAEFEADLGTVGIWEIAIDSSPSRTSFSNGLGQTIPIDAFSSGILTVTPVPEPTGICLALLGLMLLVGYKRVTRE